MKSGNYPLSRKDNIVIQELPEEVLIYDLSKNKALCLNQTSAMVWLECDGTKSVTEISRNLSQKLKMNFNEDLVWLALNQFKKDDLLADSREFTTPFDGLNRREIVKRIGFASIVALPLISSVVAPTALHAQSGSCGPIGSCTGGGGICVCNPIVQPGGNNNPGGCPCATAGDCIIDPCICGNPCTLQPCPVGETCQMGICFDGQNPGSQAPCNGPDCPVNTSCNTDGTCSGVCPPGNNVCSGPTAPICVPNNGANLNADCCPCGNSGDCLNDCNNGVCGPPIPG